MLIKHDCTIKKVQSQYWKCTHKYGIELPDSIEEALEIDHHMGATSNKRWLKEMKMIEFISFLLMVMPCLPAINTSHVTCFLISNLTLPGKHNLLLVVTCLISQGSQLTPAWSHMILYALPSQLLP